jgi:hypothetical protein
MDGDVGENRRKFGMFSSQMDFNLLRNLSEKSD